MPQLAIKITLKGKLRSHLISQARNSIEEVKKLSKSLGQPQSWLTIAGIATSTLLFYPILLI